MNLRQLKRNYLLISCPACGGPCHIQTSRNIQEKGKDAIVACRDLECRYQGTLKISYGPVLQAKNPAPIDAHEPLRPGLRNQFLRILCPHCGGVCRVRTSVQVISAQRTAYVYCQDEAHCGYRGVVFLTHDTRLVINDAGDLRSIPLDPETAEQCQQSMDFEFSKHDHSKSHNQPEGQ